MSWSPLLVGAAKPQPAWQAAYLPRFGDKTGYQEQHFWQASWTYPRIQAFSLPTLTLSPCFWQQNIILHSRPICPILLPIRCSIQIFVLYQGICSLTLAPATNVAHSTLRHICTEGHACQSGNTDENLTQAPGVSTALTLHGFNLPNHLRSALLCRDFVEVGIKN